MNDQIYHLLNPLTTGVFLAKFEGAFARASAKSTAEQVLPSYPAGLIVYAMNSQNELSDTFMVTKEEI
jgi:hypothetical protein